MGSRRTDALPASLEAARRRFERWRRTRPARSRIPEALWASAVKAAGKHGVHRTAKALRLDYYSLKERVEVAAQGESGRGDATHGKSGRGDATHGKSDRNAVAVLRTSGREAAADGESRGGAVAARGKAAAARGGVAAGGGEDGTTTSATFVEVMPPVSGGASECILELEDPGGAKMRVHLKGVEAPDLAALTRSFRDTT
jgi:hypothetical protein